VRIFGNLIKSTILSVILFVLLTTSVLGSEVRNPNNTRITIDDLYSEIVFEPEVNDFNFVFKLPEGFNIDDYTDLDLVHMINQKLDDISKDYKINKVKYVNVNCEDPNDGFISIIVNIK
jgi:hypothetical protein